MHTAAIPASVVELTETLSALPGIGPKTASRLAFFLLRGKSDLALRLAEALKGLVERTRFCSICYNVTEAARQLGLAREHVYYYLNKYGIRRPD